MRFALLVLVALAAEWCVHVKAQNRMLPGLGYGYGGGQGQVRVGGGRGGQGQGWGSGEGGEGQGQVHGRGQGGQDEGWGAEEGGQGQGGQGQGGHHGGNEGDGVSVSDSEEEEEPSSTDVSKTEIDEAQSMSRPEENEMEEEEEEFEEVGPDSSPGRIIRDLLDNHDEYERTIEELYNGENELIGAQTITKVKNHALLSQGTTDQLVNLLRVHVRQMKDHQPRRWDPLFATLYANKDKIEEMEINENVTHGVEVWARGETGCPAESIWKHAETVSLFVEDGRAEAKKSHSAPPSCG